MKYIQEIYSNDTLSDEKKYLTYQFFSLDLAEKPWDLYQKLRSLNERLKRSITKSQNIILELMIVFMI